jgi:hypothetical protein
VLGARTRPGHPDRARDRAVASGIAAGRQIDDLVSDLRAAKDGGYEWVSLPFFLDLTLRNPLAA